jgi:hypothetical protein
VAPRLSSIVISDARCLRVDRLFRQTSSRPRIVHGLPDRNPTLPKFRSAK